MSLAPQRPVRIPTPLSENQRQPKASGRREEEPGKVSFFRISIPGPPRPRHTHRRAESAQEPPEGAATSHPRCSIGSGTGVRDVATSPRRRESQGAATAAQRAKSEPKSGSWSRRSGRDTATRPHKAVSPARLPGAETPIGSAWLRILFSISPTLQRRTLQNGAPRAAGNTPLGGSF